MVSPASKVRRFLQAHAFQRTRACRSVCPDREDHGFPSINGLFDPADATERSCNLNAPVTEVSPTAPRFFPQGVRAMSAMLPAGAGFCLPLEPPPSGDPRPDAS